MSRKYKLNKNEGKFLGVCAGFADYFNADPMLIRIAFVILCCVTFSMAVLLYFIIAFLAD